MLDMKTFIQQVKRAAIDAWIAQKPCDITVCRVTQISPVVIAYGQLLIPEALTVFVGDCKQSLRSGDSVAVIRKTGGQQYFVLGVVGQ
ncbi:MAG: DUF2577 family protein [Clostridia bacterium]|nr:DUF2577 family protein [Clostridia bacterium]